MNKCIIPLTLNPEPETPNIGACRTRQRLRHAGECRGPSSARNHEPQPVPLAAHQQPEHVAQRQGQPQRVVELAGFARCGFRILGLGFRAEGSSTQVAKTISLRTPCARLVVELCKLWTSDVRFRVEGRGFFLNQTTTTTTSPAPPPAVSPAPACCSSSAAAADAAIRVGFGSSNPFT